MNIGTDGEFPEIEYRLAVAGRVESVKACLPADHLLPSRLIGWIAVVSYRSERLFTRLVAGS